MTEIGSGTRVFEAAPVRGAWRRLSSPDEVLELMDTTAEGVVACVADAGATFLAPIFDDLTAVVCLSGTPQSHIGIVSREYQVPCVMAVTMSSDPADGDEVEIDCSGEPGIVLVAAVSYERADIDRQLRYHSEISYALTMERTALESALIPVSAYVLIACVECYRRYPVMIEAITAAVTPGDLGRRGHELTTQVDPVHMWAVPNFPLVGRKVLMAAGMVDPDDDIQRLGTIFDFWNSVTGTYRFDDGTHQAADSGGTARSYRHYVDDIVAGCEPIGDDTERGRVSRLNALLTSYLFLLWFDTRSGYQDTGPYELSDGRRLLLRAYNRLGVSHFPWSADVSAAMPDTEVLGAFILRDVEFKVTDFGTSVTKPEDYWPHVESFAYFDVADGKLRPLGDDERDALGASAKTAQKQLYRTIAAMERRAKIDAGAYVYFTFLRPFAELAGVELDWTVPRDSLDLYPLLELIDGSLDQAGPVEQPETYYLPVP